MLYHVIHLCVELIWPEHISVFFADFFDGLEGQLDAANVSWVQVLN